MTGRGRVLLAVALATAVVMVGPVVALNTAVGSINQTATELSNANTLSDVSVQGSGAAANVTLRDEIFDSFEDGTLTDDWTGDETFGFLEISIQDSPSYHRDKALLVGDGGSDTNLSRGLPSSTPNTVSYAYREDDPNANFVGKHHLYVNQSGSAVLEVLVDDGDICGDAGSVCYHTGTGYADTNINLQPGTWYRIAFENIDYGAESYKLVVYNRDGSVRGSQSVSSFQTSANSVDRINIVNNSTQTYHDAFAVADPAETGTYIGAEHQVDTVTAGFANLSLDNATAEVTWQGNNGNGWTDISSATRSSTGNFTQSVSGYDRYRVNVTLTGDGDADARLHDEGVLFDNHDPSVDNSTATPSGGTVVQKGGANLSVDVSDPEFGASQSETVTAEFYVNNSKVGTETVNSNGTVSHVENNLPGGDHTWRVELSDEYGGSATSQTFQFSIPATLFIRNETNASQLVKSPTTVEVNFFAENGSVIERSVTDGTVNMSGLPVDQEFVVKANADGYHSRTIVIESLLQQDTIYLLNKSTATSADIVFELDDSTGRFAPSETTLFVEKPINQSNTTKFRVIISDEFGAANEIATTLENEQRYRLRVENNQGETRVLGSYTTAGNDRTVLPIGDIRLSGDTQQSTVFGAAVVETNSGPAVRVQYRDPTTNTTDLRIEITEVATGDTLRANTSETGPFGTYTETVPIPASDPENATYRIQYHANRSGDPDVGDTLRRGDVVEIAANWNIDDQVLELMGYALILGVTGLLVIINGPLAALGGTVTATILTFIGVVPIPMPLIGLAGAVALLFNIGGR